MTYRLALSIPLALLALAGCGGNTGAAREPAAGASTATTSRSDGSAIGIGLVTDVGGLDDRSFNSLANQGLERAQAELGVRGRVLVSKTEADYVPNLTSLAKQGHDLVIAVGLPMAEALERVAARYPDVSFAIVDYSQRAMETRPKNVRGLLFKEQEAGYLVGYLAGLLTKEEAGSRQVIGSVGGMKIPSVDRYIAGYQAGAKAANPKIETLNAYSQDLIDQAKCKQAALDQIGRGARVIFQVAGRCGLGALSAAEEKNVRAIGVDTDQAYLGEHVLTSALKNVDVAVFQTIQAAQDGSFRGGENIVFDIASGGVGLGEVASHVPADLVSRVNKLQDRIAAGKVAGIPEKVG